MRIQSRVLVPPDGNGASRASDDSEKMSRRASSTPWTAVLAKESIAPDATAVAGLIP